MTPLDKHLAILNKQFYIANDNTIKIIQLEGEPTKEEPIYLEKEEDQIRTYHIKQPSKIHGFIENKHSYAGKYLITLVETEDNQIDFARLNLKNQDVLKGEIYFLQYGEVAARSVRFDPIQKL